MSYREAIQHEKNSTDHALLVKAQLPQPQSQQQCTQPSAWDQPSDPWEAHDLSAEAWLEPAAEDNSSMTKELLRTKEHQYRADQVDDMIPFWIRGIEAAERGEVLRLEEFLDSLENENWPPRGHDPWTHGDRHSNYGGRVFNAWEPTTWDNDLTKWIVKPVSSPSAEGGRATRGVHSDAILTTSHVISPSTRDPNSLVEVVARQNAADENRKREMYSFLELPTNEKVKKIDDLIRTLRSS
ncbi:hypothetical protein J3R30DRAFT_1426651 [Lentinula aciculospora]|uniref:Uncharacterized protein n=1 Tax=Lentinula aciculospora TaxID=153920 RepID=A0A9W9ANJ6_9AGAR|nr:hypothetical protein J3R30DRAFT_1426651 [Lentinula aciculospora]